MKKYILVVIFGLLCALGNGNYIGFLIALNLALYFNAVDTPFEKPELWMYHIPALANATYGLNALVYASGFLAFVPLAVYICFLYSLCVVICAVRERFQNLR